MAVVVYPAALYPQLRAWGEVAIGLGLGAAFTRALREMDGRLRAGPEAWGDPLWDVRGLRLTVYHRYGPVLVVRYAVCSVETLRSEAVFGRARLLPSLSFGSAGASPSRPTALPPRISTESEMEAIPPGRMKWGCSMDDGRCRAVVVDCLVPSCPRQSRTRTP
ncbi:MAG: hypothetical protein C0501_12880 [Isosphaera sp.]|nr:hypothetical protein [Isosphaera sp.]